MKLSSRVSRCAALLILCAAATVSGQTPPAAQEPPAATPTPAAVPPSTSAPATPAATRNPPVSTPTPSTLLRIVDPPSVSIALLPTSNPFGSTAQVPAALPTRLPLTDASVSVAAFVSVHVDAAGRALSVRRDRDPIPSLAAETLKSVGRWQFSPARRGGQPVETWGAFRLDLTVEVRAPKILQSSLTPVTPATAIPAPLPWPSDADWLATRHASNPTDGSVPIDELDTTPMPQKAPWTDDSYKGPFAIKYWVKIDKTGRVERAIPLDVSDPVLLPYFRRSIGGWAFRPAQNGGAPVDSWNELVLSGTVSYSDEIKQIQGLRKNIGS